MAKGLRMIDAHVPLGIVSQVESEKYSKVPVIKKIAGSKKESQVRRLRFYAGDVCEKNHRIRDLITHTKIPYSVRFKENDKCVWCEFFSRVNRRKPKKKRNRKIRDSYRSVKDKAHRA